MTKRMFRAYVFALLGFLPATLAARDGACSQTRLDTAVNAARLQNVNLVEALIEVGRQTGICFGVDIREAAWVERRFRFAQHVSIADLLAAFHLGSSYHVEGNVVTVRVGTQASRDWLDVTIPTFQIVQSPLAVASDKLFTFLLAIAHPKATGSLGSILISGGSAEVKNVAMKEASVRSILNALVAGSTQAGMWFTTGVHPRSKATTGAVPPWTVLSYSEPAGLVDVKLKDAIARGYQR